MSSSFGWRAELTPQNQIGVACDATSRIRKGVADSESRAKRKRIDFAVVRVEKRA